MKPGNFPWKVPWRHFHNKDLLQFSTINTSRCRSDSIFCLITSCIKIHNFISFFYIVHTSSDANQIPFFVWLDPELRSTTSWPFFVWLDPKLRSTTSWWSLRESLFFYYYFASPHFKIYKIWTLKVGELYSLHNLFLDIPLSSFLGPWK